MADKWFAECKPCAWSEQHEIQDDAIRAAEDHVYVNHRSVPPEIRLAQGIGHVQNRTVNAVAIPAQQSTQTAGDDGAERVGPFVPNVT